MSDISDILKLAEAINKKASDDKDFKDLLGEVSAALAEILDELKKPEDKRDEQAEADAMGKAIGAALADGLKSIKPPAITLPAPAGSCRRSPPSRSPPGRGCRPRWRASAST